MLQFFDSLLLEDELAKKEVRSGDVVKASVDDADEDVVDAQEEAHQQEEGSGHAPDLDGQHGRAVVTQFVLVQADVVVEENLLLHFELF